MVAEQLEVRQAARDVGVHVDEHPVGPGRGERDGLAEQAVRADRRMLVDDVREVVADDDQVHAGVRSGAGPVLGQRLAGRLLHGERDRRRAARGTGLRARKPPSVKTLAGATVGAVRPLPEPPQPASARIATSDRASACERGGSVRLRHVVMPVLVSHPLAWSRIRAVNGGPFLGVIWKASAHLPTITSAGAARE